MKGIRWLWKELTRKRGHSSHRFYRTRDSRAGVALLMTTTSILFLTILVTEIVFSANVRLQLGAHQRDEAKAEMIALTGVRLYHLVLVASKQMGSALASFTGGMGDTLWQMLPSINTGLLRMVFISDDIDEEDARRIEQEGLNQEEREASMEEMSSSRHKDNFLSFEGDFFADVVDEESKLSIAGFSATTFADLQTDPAAFRLYGLMSGETNDQFFHEENIERWELIGNLIDWTDADDARLYQGGSEDQLYQKVQPPYLAKDAAFDSLKEVRLVEGWHRDDVWERFGDKLTIYGNGKVNINTASREVLAGIMYSYCGISSEWQVDQMMTTINEYRAITTFSDTSTFITLLESAGCTPDDNLSKYLTTESTVFRITSTGVVGDASVTIVAIIDFSSDKQGDVVYWNVQ